MNIDQGSPQVYKGIAAHYACILECSICICDILHGIKQVSVYLDVMLIGQMKNTSRD